MLCLVVAPTQGAVVVQPCGALDMGASLRLGAILTDLIVGQHNLCVTVDLAKVGRFEPDALGIVSEVAASIVEQGGSLVLRAPRPDMVEALTAAGLAQLIGSNQPLPQGPLPLQEILSRRRHPAGSALGDANPARIAPSSRSPKRKGS